MLRLRTTTLSTPILGYDHKILRGAQVPPSIQKVCARPQKCIDSDCVDFQHNHEPQRHLLKTL